MPGASEPGDVQSEAKAFSTRTALLGLLGLVTCVVVTLGGLALESRRLPPTPRAKFDQGPLRAMRKRPDYVLLGNSMVYTRLDERLLNSLIAPRRALMLPVGGSMTALWYVQIKNYIVRSRYRPKRLIIFFRNEELTRVLDATTGSDLRNIERASPEDDPVLAAKLIPSWNTPTERLKWFFWREIPRERLRDVVESPIEELATHFSEVLVPGSDPRHRKQLSNSLFGQQGARDGNEKPDPTDLDPRPFEVVANESLLPDILELVTQNQIPTVFVRVRTRARAKGLKEPKALRRYTADLRKYIEGHGADFTDMSHEEWETFALFGNGDHIGFRHTAEYTRLFVEHMSDLFP